MLGFCESFLTRKMVIFRGNLVCESSFWHQLLVPWAKKKGGNSCLRCKVYSCLSFPVRYICIPNQSSKTSPMPIPIPGSPRSLSFVFDHKSQHQRLISKLSFGPIPGVEEEEVGCDLGIVDHELLEDLEGVKNDQVEDLHSYPDVLRAEKTKQDAEKLAIQLLATRAFSAVELRKKLHGKKFHLDIVDAVITDFQGRGLINDCLYAETFSRSRWSSLNWGPRRIKQALLKKGVSEVNADKAIKLVFEDGDSEKDQESRLGLSKLSMDHLFVQAKKQWLRGRNAPSETRKSRIIRWLQYRGFNWGVITFILKKLQSEYPP